MEINEVEIYKRVKTIQIDSCKIEREESFKGSFTTYYNYYYKGFFLANHNTSCPEQYYIYYFNKCIGYIRLRFGSFSVDYYKNFDKSNSIDDVLLDFYGDDLCGEFENEEDRQLYLKLSVEKIIELEEERLKEIAIIEFNKQQEIYAKQIEKSSKSFLDMIFPEKLDKKEIKGKL